MGGVKCDHSPIGMTHAPGWYYRRVNAFHCGECECTQDHLSTGDGDTFLGIYTVDSDQNYRKHP
jgi:hypothetical protein